MDFLLPFFYCGLTGLIGSAVVCGVVRVIEFVQDGGPRQLLGKIRGRR